MRIWYKLIRKVFDRYESRLKKDISPEVVKLFQECKIDLYEVRFNNKVLSTEQVDMVLGYGDKQSTGESLVMQRIFHKNILLQCRCMEEGYVKVSEEEAKMFGMEHKEFNELKLWEHDPVIPQGVRVVDDQEPYQKEMTIEEAKELYLEHEDKD